MNTAAAAPREEASNATPVIRRSRIPFGGCVIDRRTVKNHRYLRDHGLPHSKRVAEVQLPRRDEPIGSPIDLVRGIGSFVAFIAAAAMRTARVAR